MRIYKDISEINTEQWQELVKQSSYATYFQTIACYHFFDSLSFATPFVYAVSEEEKLTGLIMGYVISDGQFLKKFFSKRAIVFGGPLLHTDISKDALTELLLTTKKCLSTKAIYIESRNFNDYSPYKQVFEIAGFRYVAHLNFHVATLNYETALKQLSSTKRRDVKLSMKAGAEYCLTTDKSDIEEYYAILSNLYRTKVKTPLFSIEFFKSLLLQPEAKFFVVKYDGKVIGGSVCVELAGETLYEWFVCGLDGQLKNIYPSTLATWAAIEYSATHGLKRFDMMGAGKPEEGYGVRDFKAKFGGQLVEQGRFIHINSKFLFKLGQLGVKWYRHSFRKTSKTPKTLTSPYTIDTEYEKIDCEAWSNFVYNHPEGNIFQTPEMYELYAKTSKFNPLILIAKNPKGAIVGCLLAVVQRECNNIIGRMTMRSVVYGGPIVENDHPEILEALLSSYNKLISRKVIYTQFRNIVDKNKVSTVFHKNGFEWEDHLDILIDLSKSREELEQELHKERRRNISKAGKEGLVFKHLCSREEIIEAVALLKETYSRVKVPMSYEDMFLYSKGVLGDHVHYFGVYFDGKMIAGQVCLFYKDLVYAWFAGSDSKYFKKYPNDFLLWNVLLWSKEKGYKMFDFGGAGKPDIPYGVRDYKLKYGGELVNYGRFVKTHKPLLMFFIQNFYSIYKRFLK